MTELTHDIVLADSESQSPAAESEHSTIVVESFDTTLTNVSSADSAPDDVSFRRSMRDKKLTLKAKENKILELSQALIKLISDQLIDLETFLDNAEEQSDETVETFLVKVESSEASLNDMYNELVTLSENKVIPQVQTMFDKFLADVRFVKDYCTQRAEDRLREEAELLEYEKRIEESKKRLAEDMKLLEERMTNSRARLQEKLHKFSRSSSAATNDVRSSQTAPSSSLRQQSLVLPPVQPSQPARANLYTYEETQSCQSQNLLSPSQSISAVPSASWANNKQDDPYQAGVQPQAQSLAQDITEHMHISLLAPPEPSVYTGDPLDYADWRVSFDSLIDSKRGSPIEKLHRLKKYVGGTAKEAISGYFRLQTADAYKEALNTLQEEFGREDMIENSFRDKLEEWPEIRNRDNDALKRYSYFLRQCLAAQRAIPKLQVLDDKRENKKFIRALPGWLVNRWTYYVTDQEEKGGFPNFAKYVEFIAHEARVSTNSLRNTEDKKQPSKQSTSKEKPIRSFQTSMKNVKSCLYCQKGPHAATECRSLAAKSEEEKESFVREHKLCFGCLKPGHNSRVCAKRARCNKCDKPHPTALHRHSRDTTKDQNKLETTKDQPQKFEEHSNTESRKTAHAIKREGKVNLLNMVLPVYVSAGSKEQLVYALLDTQSDASFVTSKLANQIKPSYTTEKITMTTLHGESTQLTNRYSISIRGYGTKYTQTLRVEAYEQGDIPCSRQQIPNKDHIAELPHLKQILQDFPPAMDIPVGILLGVDCTAALVPHEVIRGKQGQAFAMRTVLGWTLCGEAAQPNKTKIVRHTVIEEQNHSMNDSDNLYHEKLSQNDIQFIKILDSGSTRLSDGSWCLPLPFKENTHMPDNKAQAERRLEQLLRKLNQDPEYKGEYCKFMKEMIDNGHAELAPETSKDGKTWYLPHFGVRHPKKDKLRVVFDASAKFRSHSLNDHLLTGPDAINSLIGILLRFRKKRIGLSCDIEKMFYNFLVSEEHRDFLRFLWVDPDEKQAKTQIFRMTRHLFGATSSPGVATYALRKIAEEYSQEMPIASSFIIKDFYVDDGITSLDSIKETVKLIQDTREICKSANLHLHKFLTNSREVLHAIPPSERVKQAQNLDLFQDKLPSERTLGLEWSVDTDTIRFLNNMKPMPPTRRGILSVISQLYDPLGLLAPFTLEGKLLSQKACQEKGDWDQQVSSNLQREWEKWNQDLRNLEAVQVERCLVPKDFGDTVKTEIHHFSDASLKGYGACSYLRLMNNQKRIHVTLLMAKSRVVPLKNITIPRLELQAALEAVKLSAIQKAELKLSIDKEYFWTDSSIILGYIKNSEARYHMFVANRVQQIRNNSNPTQWQHIPGKDNPADILSRGATIQEMQSSTWWSGPGFLQQPDIPTQWNLNMELPDLSTDDPEVKHTKKSLNTKISPPESLAHTFKKFSSWTRLVRAIANVSYMLKAKRWCKPDLSTADLKTAERVIIMLAQKEILGEHPVSKQSFVASLSPFIDKDGLLRVGGRTKKSLALSDQEKNPIIIPKASWISRLIVTHVHRKVYHQGQTMTLGALRGYGYWITGAAKLIKEIIYRCVFCKATRGLPMKQMMGDLPPERLDPSPPFTHVGVDCFGPYIVKDRRSEIKRWGLLITCMYSRAVHIEILESMTTDALINALRCLICIRGAVKTVFCDNGTNLVGANNEIMAEFKAMKDGARHFLKDDMIEFKFNAPGASHAGGVWERQIRTVKSVLNSLVASTKGRMNTEALRAAFYEAMNIINNRPLSVENLNKPNELVVTPNHLLTMKPREAPALPGEIDKSEVYGGKMWKKTQAFAEMFWEAWKVKYMADITQRQKWTQPHRNIRSGDLVLIVNDSQSRNQWPMAIVEEPIPSTDGLVRKARVRVANRYLSKEGQVMEKATKLERPIQKLILLLPIDDK